MINTVHVKGCLSFRFTFPYSRVRKGICHPHHKPYKALMQPGAVTQSTPYTSIIIGLGRQRPKDCHELKLAKATVGGLVSSSKTNKFIPNNNNIQL